VSSGEFINHMYRNVFGREPDIGGYNFWKAEIDSRRRSMPDVLVEMTQSNEYVRLTLDSVVAYPLIHDCFADEYRTECAFDPALLPGSVPEPPGNGAHRVPLNDTGISWGGNYASGNNASCIGETIAQQDCSHGRDLTNNDDSDGHAGFSYTKLDANGNALSASASSWSCVRDNVTGLVWEVKTDDDGIHDKDNTYRWGGIGAEQYGTVFYDDWDVLVNGTNSESLCGFSDWRVPEIDELESIVNFNRFNPAIDSVFFPDTRASHFWSSSASAYGSRYAWYVGFGYGNSNYYYYRNYGRHAARHVRLVRGGQ